MEGTGIMRVSTSKRVLVTATSDRERRRREKRRRESGEEEKEEDWTRETEVRRARVAKSSSLSAVLSISAETYTSQITVPSHDLTKEPFGLVLL